MWRGLVLGLAIGGLLIAGVPIAAVQYLETAGGPAGAVEEGGSVRDGLAALFRVREGVAAIEDAAGAATPEEPQADGDGEPHDLPDPDGVEPAADPATQFDEIYRRHGPPGAFGLVITDPDGEVVYEHHADRPLIPASTQKLITAALALETLGADHRLRTELHATGPVEDGILHGDLIVVGGGDPALGDPLWGRALPQRPRTPLEALAAGVADAGIREVHGHVIGFANVLPWEPEAPGWPSRYLANGHTTRSSGLTINGGRRLRNSGGQVHGEPADSPALETARSLRRLLNDHDVAVAGGPGLTDELPGATNQVAAVDSPPLAELLRYMVRRSDNHLADTIWRVAGQHHGDGSWGSGAEGAVAVLEGMGIDVGGAQFVDGSGLSRDNRLTARQLVQLDQRMAAAHGPTWDRLMAVAGQRGTLRRRLAGTAAAGQLHGKTGTLRDVRALAGGVHGPEDRWHMALVANDLDGSAIRRFRRLSDDLAVGLAHQARGCDVLAGC